MISIRISKKSTRHDLTKRWDRNKQVFKKVAIVQILPVKVGYQSTILQEIKVNRIGNHKDPGAFS